MAKKHSGKEDFYDSVVLLDYTMAELEFDALDSELVLDDVLDAEEIGTNSLTFT